MYSDDDDEHMIPVYTFSSFVHVEEGYDFQLKFITTHLSKPHVLVLFI